MNSFLKKGISLSLITTSLFVAFSQTVFAQTINIPQPSGVLTDIPVIISAAIKLILIVAGIIAFVFMLLGGIKWITSEGDKGQVDAARNQIMQAVIGVMVVFASWGLIIIIEQATNIGLGFSRPIKFPTFYNSSSTNQDARQTCIQGCSTNPGAGSAGYPSCVQNCSK